MRFKIRNDLPYIDAFLFGIDEIPEWFQTLITNKKAMIYGVPFSPEIPDRSRPSFCKIFLGRNLMTAVEGTHYIVKTPDRGIHVVKKNLFLSLFESLPEDSDDRKEEEHEN